MKYRKLTAGVIAGAAALLAGLGSGVVQAAPASPAALPVVQDVTAVLPIMGAQLTVHVQTGPGGNITLAEITPAGGTATADPNRVSFSSTGLGGDPVKVNVRSKGNTQSISARAGSLKDISGDGSWAGGVFDVTKPVTVKYTVAESTTTPGAPDVKVTDPADGTTAADGSKVQVLPAVQMNDEEGGMSAVAKVVFTLNGQSRTLSIGARVRTFVPEADDDNESGTVPAAATPITVASLRITLSGFKGVAQALPTAPTSQTWKGFLCDGTAASIAYILNPDGTIALDPAVTPAIVPDPAEPAKVQSNRIEVRFGDKARVQIQSRVNNGQVTVNVRDRIRCKGAADPTINGATVNTDNAGGQHGGHDGKGKGNGGGDD